MRIPTTYAIRFTDAHLDITSDEIVALEYAQEFRRGNHSPAKIRTVERIVTITCMSVQIDAKLRLLVPRRCTTSEIIRTVEHVARAGFRNRRTWAPTSSQIGARK